MKFYEHDTTALRMKSFVNWKERPWGDNPISSKETPNAYRMLTEFENDAASIEPYNKKQLEQFKEKWDIHHIWYLKIGVPGVQIWRDKAPIYTLGIGKL